jgi:hypothetical protein
MRHFLGSQKFLMMYSGVLTAVFAVTVLAGFGPRSSRQKFEQIDVERINVIEPDGTLRLVISNRSLAPGIIIKGKELLHADRKAAGMIFYNDEGTENGGLTFGGQKSKDGKESSFGHLSFDRYEQDQVFTIDAQQEGSSRTVGLSLNDQPDYPIQELIAVVDRTKDLPAPQREVEINKFLQARGSAHQRLSIYRTSNGAVEFKMKDTQGRDRLVLGVGADGVPALQLLDERGKVIGELPAAK